MSHPIDRSTKQFGKNTTILTQQPREIACAVIDAKPQTAKEDILDIITELKGILRDSIKALSPEDESA